MNRVTGPVTGTIPVLSIVVAALIVLPPDLSGYSSASAMIYAATASGFSDGTIKLTLWIILPRAREERIGVCRRGGPGEISFF
ncbi:hypothetical protein NKH93_30930 [Mesorhizobium sp. M0954]|uniref:hypothetical protein n=1 Tax=Mesorhizobium sp. M0954 TaxID=2957032 RepID=UPI003338DC6F